MHRLLRKVSISFCPQNLIRAVAMATAGSGLLYACSNSDCGARISLSFPVIWNGSPSLQFLQGFREPSLFTSSEKWKLGKLEFFSRVSSAPAGDVNSRVSPASSGNINAKVSPAPSEAVKKQDDPGSVVVKDEAEPHCRCLGRNTIANAAAKVGPAVVNIAVPQGFHGITLGKSIGSGTIIDEDGTILTCAHVVVDFQGIRRESKGKVDVTLQDGRTFEGTVLNADLHSDIAIVKINSKTPLPTAKLGSSSKLRPGDWVLAVGCPLSLQNTVTAGIVSCVDRKSSDLGLGGMRREYLQTDCAINAAADGLSFAVPVDAVAKIIEHFKKRGRVVRPWLGLKMLDLNKMIVAQLKERDPSFPNVQRGVLVPMVTPGSPADRAGFHPGDVVIKFDGKPVESIKEIIEIMGDRVGMPMKVVVQRANDNVVILTVTPEEANPDM
ncbi:putative protease Do-like 14 isoform X2 [Mangifera indica]|uniref:putative protease Do-like 14 isoform X2 n=1 Tax=Mangifera indica TaxID=29780 RepID=UPI001CFB6D4C|nr:putative protease Do-like 14 isoform X2 [Mangifera indica]